MSDYRSHCLDLLSALLGVPQPNELVLDVAQSILADLRSEVPSQHTHTAGFVVVERAPAERVEIEAPSREIEPPVAALRQVEVPQLETASEVAADGTKKVPDRSRMTPKRLEALARAREVRAAKRAAAIITQVDAPDAPQIKRCKGPCGELKTIEEFNVNRSTKDGREPKCRDCMSAHLKARRAASNPQPDAPAPVYYSSVKRCDACGHPKPLADFIIDRSSPDGRQPQCRMCRSASHRDEGRQNGQRQANAIADCRALYRQHLAEGGIITQDFEAALMDQFNLNRATVLEIREDVRRGRDSRAMEKTANNAQMYDNTPPPYRGQ